MSLISRAVAHLFSGVSQQPAAARDPSFVETAENAYPVPAEGLLKRYPTEHIDKLAADLLATTYFCHWIIRGTTAADQYLAVFTGAGVRVFRLDDGTEMTVDTPDGVTYITTSAPRTDLKAVSLLDTTFVVNTTQVTALTAARTGQSVAGGAIASITRSSQTATVTTTPDHGLTTGWWILMAGATQTEYNGWFQITVTGLKTFTYTVTGTPVTPATGSPAYTAYKNVTKGKKQTFSALPTVGLTNGDVWEITNDDANAFDSFYVKWNATDSVWEETTEPGITYEIDDATMPWTLTKTGATTFTFTTAEWKDRVVGSELSSPNPSFIGEAITDIFFFRNRLGVLSTNNMVLTRVGDPYHFWRRTVTASPDDDPIDRTVTHEQELTLHWALPFTNTLMLFSNVAQHLVNSSDIFSNATARADTATKISASSALRPIGIGSDALFASTRTTTSSIYEYFVNKDAVTNTADEVTQHIPSYLPADLFAGTASSDQDAAVFVSSTEMNTLYVYKRKWVGDDRVQSAWQRWTFDDGDSVVGVKFIGSTLYLAIVRADGIFLEQARLESGVVDVVTDYPTTDDGFRVMLDRKVELTGVYDAGTGLTTWTLPYAETGTMQAILGTAWTGRKGEKLVTTLATSTTLTAPTNLSANAVWVGRQYTKRVRLTETVLRDRNGLAMVSGRLQLKFMRVMLGATGYLRAEVTPAQRSTSTYPYTGKILGTATATLGRAALGAATFMFPVLSDSRKVTIELVNDSYLPSAVLGYEWEGAHYARSGR